MIGRGLMVLMATALVVGCGSGGQRVAPLSAAGDQMEFGLAMAQRGLWSEALFRFEQASTANRTVGVLNNLAVANEALGRFDEALEYYQEALQLSPSDPELRNNYNRFVSFYESFRVEVEGGDETESESVDETPESVPATTEDGGAA